MGECIVGGVSGSKTDGWQLIEELDAVLSGNSSSKSAKVTTEELLKYRKLKLQVSGSFVGAGGADSNIIYVMGEFYAIGAPRNVTRAIDVTREGMPVHFDTNYSGTPSAAVLLFGHNTDSFNTPSVVQMSNTVSISCNQYSPASCNIHVRLYGQF